MGLKCVVGGRDSVSFVSVAEADVIIKQLPDDETEWNALNVSEKELRLVLAARMLSTLPFRGLRTYRGQALCFPRLCYNAIPQEIKEAQVFVAYSVVHRELGLRPAVSDDPGGDIKSINLGGLLSVTFASMGNSFDLTGRSLGFPVVAKLARWLTQIRGGVFLNEDEEPTLSTTTTTISTTSTTSTSTTTTTTAP